MGIRQAVSVGLLLCFFWVYNSIWPLFSSPKNDRNKKKHNRRMKNNKTNNNTDSTYLFAIFIGKENLCSVSFSCKICGDEGCDGGGGRQTHRTLSKNLCT